MNRPETEALERLINRGSRKAQSIGADVLVSHIQPLEAVDPLDLFTAAESMTSDRWYWEHPDGERAMTSLGILSGITPPRNVRFSEVDRYLRQYASSATVDSETRAQNVAPVFFVAYSYNPHFTQDRLVWQGFPSTHLLTPRMTVIREGNTCSLIQNTIVGPRLDPVKYVEAANTFNDELIAAIGNQRDSKLIVDELPPDKTNETELRQFLQTVSRADAAIRNNEFEVLNVVRRQKRTTGGLYRLNRALKYLRGRFPNARVVAAGRHGSTFLGYSPDILVGKHGDNVLSTSSAGSIRRGEDPNLDAALAAQLINNADEVERHELSVDHLFETYEAHCADVEASDEPVIRSTPDRHTLYSTVKGRLESSSSLMDLIAAIHPSVEASGSPVETAADFLHREEQTDRGWFTAPFGWTDLNGNGEFVSASHAAVVRSPVLHQQRAYLFASVAIQSGTDPEDLLAQTDLELEPLRTALSK